MTVRVLAPQFGLAGHFDPVSGPPDSPFFAVRTPRADGGVTPVVTVKRRRLPQGDPDSRHGGDEASGEQAEAARTPKVFRLANVRPAAPAEAGYPMAAAGSPSEGSQEELGAAVSRKRRERDPLRQPKLIQHVVLQPEPAPVEAAPTRALPSLDFSFPAADEYETVCRALERVKRDLEAAHEASRFRSPIG